jgi:hypothetical protein
MAEICAYTIFTGSFAISEIATPNHHTKGIEIMNLNISLLAKLTRRITIVLASLATSIPLYANNSAASADQIHDHLELDAALVAPYTSERANEARTFTLRLAYPTDAAIQVARWRVQLRAPDGTVVHEWRGATSLTNGEADVVLDWPGRVGKNSQLADGIYRVHMNAFSVERSVNAKLAADVTELEDIAKTTDADVIDQTWDIRIGNPPTPAMPAFNALKTNPARAIDAINATEKSAPATASLPYTVYYGNLHSQTNHSDGGGNVSSCTSSQAAQTGQFGPADAFPYAKNAGLDFLLTSEHNHYFDGSSGTNGSASPTAVKNLYQSGLTAASNFNTANAGFLAIYGMEWGVINNGGHMNIFNSNELLGWENNSSGQLLADVLTQKSDYATIYSVMKQRGLIGQFNHPDTSGQFIINGTSLAYSADADEVMVLSEVLNTSAFSNNTTETETGRSSFEGAFNILLERGFHVAPASNQDNHCANWGRSYTNRTGVLLANGQSLSSTNFLNALKARRVFATMDKNSQLILTANGRLMGERFQNSGALSLVANFANSQGRTVSTVTIYQGVPGRNGTVTVLASTATTNITPAVGKHFYYAKVTQDDGKILWSAPVWVEQVAGTGGTANTAFNETESNGTAASANVVGRSVTSIVGTMGNTTDKDYFAVSLNANEKLTLNMTGPTGKDYDLYLVNSAGTTLASSLGSTATESLTYTNGSTASTVYIRVIAYSGSSTTLTYIVKLSYQ